MKKQIGIVVFFIAVIGFGTGVLANNVIAADAVLTVIHGIPGEDGFPVDVYGTLPGATERQFLFTFKFTEIQGPLSLPPGDYLFEVVPTGEDPDNPSIKLEAAATLEEGINYSAIAHLKSGGAPVIGLFVNNTAFIEGRNTRLAIRHTADAPAVDIALKRYFRGCLLKALNLSNEEDAPPSQFGEVDFRRGFVKVKIFPAGEKDRIFKSDWLKLKNKTSYIVYAVGTFPESFTLVIQVIDLR